MKKLRGEQSGNVLLVPVILLAVLFIAAAIFAAWAFSGRQDYKNNVDAKINSAVSANTQKVQTADAQQYANAAKNPLKTYTGPDAYGSVKVSYPKTWSAYIDTTNTSTPLDAYFHDDYVPAAQSQQTYNLRIQVTSDSYSSELSNFNSLLSEQKITAAPYTLPNVPSIHGTIITGQISPDDPTISGTLIILPLRDKSLKIWTESSSYLSDFNTYILPNLTFSP